MRKKLIQWLNKRIPKISNHLNFNIGDWIIATEIFNYPSGAKCRSYMECGILVTHITPTHIVYKGQYSPNEHIMPIDQIIGRHFVKADDKIQKVSEELCSQWWRQNHEKKAK